MDKKIALEIVASMLASETANSIRIAERIPRLKENTSDIMRKNREVAEALDIMPVYESKLAIHYPNYPEEAVNG